MRLWSAIAISGAFACSPRATPDIPPIALTPTEYNNTVRDLLGMPSDGRAWPDAPPVADRLSPSLGEQAGLFGFAPIETPPWPWVLPEDLR